MEEKAIDSDFRSLIEHTSEAVLVHDLEGRILYANPSALALAGEVSLETAMKRSVFDHLPRSVAEQGREAIGQLLNGETLTPIVAPLFLVSGERIDVEVRLNLVKFQGRKAVQVSLRDLTRQKSTEEILSERLESERALINSPVDVAVLIDPDGTILSINDNYAGVLGRPREALLGRSVWDLMPPEVKASRIVLFNQLLRSGQPLRLEEERNGRWYDIYLNPLFSPRGTVSRVVITGRDITDRKNAEKNLEETIKALQKSNDDLEMFAHIAAHDLQEPIRAIVAFSEILLRNCRAGTSSADERYLMKIEEAGLRMHRLIDDLRRYSGVRTDSVTFEVTDMEEAFTSALNNLDIAVQDSGASITHDPLPTVLFHRTWAVQVFQGLLDNAIKFRKEGVPPVVHVSAVREDGAWRFSVKDNGIGIRPEYFDKVFVLFERLHPQDVYPGTGLGLALCKRMVEQLGGRIWVESEFGTGSTFSFTLKKE
jgi:PAS domain S-box-containing protein